MLSSGLLGIRKPFQFAGKARRATMMAQRNSDEGPTMAYRTRIPGAAESGELTFESRKKGKPLMEAVEATLCKDRLPFRLADGSYIFEAVESLPELERHHHQNYLALCSIHAAMIMHANASKDEMNDRFLTLDGRDLELTLADRPVTVYFTDTHIEDLRVVSEVEGRD